MIVNPNFNKILGEALAENERRKANEGWILCNERLPKSDELVIVTVQGKYHTFVDAMYGWYLIKHGNNVLAWMPLPEPYKLAEDVTTDCMWR